MSRRARMSTPWNGSSSTSTAALSASQRATTTFCWLPPERVPIASPGERQTMSSSSISRVVVRRSLERSSQPARACRSRKGSETLPARSSAGTTALFARSRGHRNTPARIASAGLPGA